MTITRPSGSVLDASVPGGDTVKEAITKNSDAVDSVISQANTDIATKGDGDMLSTNNLSDLTSNATALTNLGGTSVGLDLFTTSNAGTARTTLGSGTVGDALFLASNAATAQQAMDVEVGADVQAFDATILNAADIDVEVTDFVFSSEGDLVYYSSNASTRLPMGTEDQVITSKSGVPSWEDSGGGGMWEFVSKTVASTAASVSFTSLADGFDYMVVLRGVYGSSANSSLQFDYGVANSYYAAQSKINFDATQDLTGDSNQAIATLLDVGVENIESRAIYGDITSYRIGSANGHPKSLFSFMAGKTNAGFEYSRNSGMVARNDATPVSALLFQASAGTLTGTFELYKRPEQ